MKAALTKDGILYGATILGDGVMHNSFSSKLMRIYNHKGIFSNMSDSEEGLKMAPFSPSYEGTRQIRVPSIHSSNQGSTGSG